MKTHTRYLKNSPFQAGFISLVLLLASHGYAQTLMLKSSVNAQGATVKLSEMLMETAGIPEAWLDRVVMEAPTDSGTVSYPITSIAYALQQYPDMKTASLSGNISIEISRAKRKILATEVQQAVRKYITNNTDENKQISLEFAPLRRSIWVPRGDTSFSVSPSRMARNMRQYNSYVVEVVVDQKPVCSIPVRVKEHALEEVWVASRALDQGQLLQKEFLRSVLLPIEKKGEKRIPITEQIHGQEVDRALTQGAPILRNYLRTPLCARKGDYITVMAQQGNLQISLRARALSTGRLGERILCMNERSKRQILVQLTGIQRARPAKL